MSHSVNGYQPYLMEDVHRESQKELFTVISTFSGGGGSSTGYRLGGGKILLVNEFIPEGIKTYRTNYPDTPIDPRDIRKITGKNGRKGVLDWLNSYGIKKGEYDILDGSPPCSTFSTSGSGKKKIEEKNVVYSDTRQDRVGMLIHDFVYLVNCTLPKVFVLENVPPIKSSDVFNHCLNRLRKWGYKVNFKVLKSSNFGVPQSRRRLILLGVRSDICEKVGFEDAEDILTVFPKGNTYEPTLRDGLKDLIIDEEERDYLLTKGVVNSSYEFLKSLPKNPSKKIGMKNLDPTWTSDFNLVRSSWDIPCSTLTATGCQGGRTGVSHPSEDRVFTTGEMKRIMSLPDDFKLTGSMKQRGERIGRMVTPLLYKELSKSIYSEILLPSRN